MLVHLLNHCAWRGFSVVHIGPFSEVLDAVAIEKPAGRTASLERPLQFYIRVFVSVPVPFAWRHLKLSVSGRYWVNAIIKWNSLPSRRIVHVIGICCYPFRPCVPHPLSSILGCEHFLPVHYYLKLGWWQPLSLVGVRLSQLLFCFGHFFYFVSKVCNSSISIT